jgi:hypothetical protein
LRRIQENFTDTFKKSVLDSFKEIERITEDAEDCALVQSQLLTIDSRRAEAFRRINNELWIIREKKSKESYGEDIKDPKKPDKDPVLPPAPQRTVKVINEISFFESGKMLENEEDVEEYIIQLRERLLRIIEEKNIRV